MIEIKNVSGRVLFTAESAADVRAALVEAVSKRADLRGAALGGAYLRGADLRGADLSGAYLCGANLCRADLYRADLCDADLRGAALGGAYLRGADLSGAALSGAALGGANLCGANLRDAKNAELVIAQTRIIPEGDVVGYKKCRNGEIVKLRVPADAKRSNASGRKCRSEYAVVIEIVDAYGNTRESATSRHDPDFDYRVGATVRPKELFDDDPFNECSSGIHFYITREEAEHG